MDIKFYELENQWATKTSKGMLSKGIYRKKVTGERFLVKGNSELGYLEPASEEIVYRIGNILGIEMLPCKLMPSEFFPEIRIYGNLNSVSMSPVIPHNIFQFYEYVQATTGKVDINYLEAYKKLGLSQEHLYKMLLLDALVGNQDRHLNNFDVCYNYNKNKVENAIMLDFGASLLYNVHERDLKIYTGNKIGPDKSKPFCETHCKQIEKLKKKLNPEYTNINIKYDLEEFKELSSEVVESTGHKINMSRARIESIKSYLAQRYKYFFLGGLESISLKKNNKIELEW